MNKNIVMVFVLLIIAVGFMGCTPTTVTFSVQNDQFGLLTSNISRGFVGANTNGLKRTKQIEGIGDIHEAQGKKEGFYFSVLEKDNNVVEIDATYFQTNTQENWAAFTELFALGMADEIKNITEKEDRESIVHDTADYLNEKFKQVISAIDVENGEKSAFISEEIGKKRVVFKANTFGGSVSVNYLIDNRGFQ